MIVYTVFDPNEGTQRMFGNKREAVTFAREQNVGTNVARVDLGKITKAVICAVFDREGYAITSEEVYEKRRETP